MNYGYFVFICYIMFYIRYTHHFISRVCSVSRFHRGCNSSGYRRNGKGLSRIRDTGMKHITSNQFGANEMHFAHTSYFFVWNGWLISFVCSHGCSEIALGWIVCFLEIPHKKLLLCFQFVRVLLFFFVLRKSSEKNYVPYASHAVISMCTLAERVRSKSNFQISRMAWEQPK